MRPIIFIDGAGTIWTARGAGLAQTSISGRSDGSMVNRRPMVTVVDRQNADREAIKALNHVCKQTAAQLVFFGAWRASQSGAHLEAALATYGMTAQLHSDWKTDGEGPNVGDEVARWLKAHQGTPGFAIVSEQPLRLGPDMKGHEVGANGHSGIESQAAVIAAAIEGRTPAEVASDWSYRARRDAMHQVVGGGARS